MTTTTPPTFRAFSTRSDRPYPDPNTMLGAAWAGAWEILLRAHGTDPLEYMAAADVASHVTETVIVKPVTVMNLLSQGAKAGVLEKVQRKVPGERGPRVRNFYRIRAGQ